MEKTHIVQMGAYPAWDEEPLNTAFHVHRIFEQDDPIAYLNANGQNVKAIATRGDLGASKAIIDALPGLEIISVYGVGFDAVDMNACAARGIAVTNTPDVLTKDVADLAVGMLLAAVRGIVPAEKWARTGDWATKGGYPLQARMHGRKVGILGLGRIGFQIARRLAAFDMEIAYTSRSPKQEAGDWAYFSNVLDLAKHSDFLIIASAATAQTRHIVNKQVIEAVGPEGVIVNISRASNIDEEALLDALENGTLGMAALDVFEGEPALNPRFTKLHNALLQPHHGSGTFATRKEMGQLMRDNLAAHFAGQPLLTPVI